ncbi:hypothetical protein FKM82_023316, partial [Ascaphus truei]
MDVINGDLNSHSDVVLNGYMNKTYQAFPNERNSDAMKICEFSHFDAGGVSTQRQMDDTAVGYEKKGKGTRIWSFVSRRKANSARSKRPQSMILTSDIIHPKPKLSFMDRVRSFKRLRSSTFSKGAVLRNSKAKAHSLPTEDTEVGIPGAVFRTRKFTDGQKPYRHSYAGYIDDLDSSFEDVELNICISECDSNENRWLRDVGVGMNDDSVFMDNQSMSSHRRHTTGSKHSNLTEGEIQRKGLKIPQEHQRGRSSYMWSYLKGISLANKDNSRKLDESQGNAFQSIERAVDNSSSSTDFDKRVEDNVEQKNSDSSSTTKPKNISGVFKFFSNMAEAARKWRGSSRSFASEDQASPSTPQTPKQQISSSKEPLVIENANALAFPSEHLQSPHSGVCDSHAQDRSSVQEVRPNPATNTVPSESVCKPAQAMEETASLEKPFSVEEMPPDSSQPAPLFPKCEADSSSETEIFNLCLDTFPEDSAANVLDESKLDSDLGADPENTLTSEPSPLEGQDEDVFECSDSPGDSHFSLSTTASSSDEDQWEDVIGEEAEKTLFGTQDPGFSPAQVPDHLERVPDHQERVPDLQEWVPDLQERVPDLQERVPDLQGLVPDLQEQVPDLQEQVPDLRERVPDLRERVPDLQEQVPVEDVHLVAKLDDGGTEAWDNDCSIPSDWETGKKSNGFEKMIPLSPADVSEDRNMLPPLRLPPTPLTVPPSFKFMPDRYMSLPLSQSTPSGLDQVGWMKKKLPSTGEADLGSKTLEVRRDSRKGRRRWRALNPESHQLPVHK